MEECAIAEKCQESSRRAESFQSEVRRAKCPQCLANAFLYKFLRDEHFYRASIDEVDVVLVSVRYHFAWPLTG